MQQPTPTPNWWQTLITSLPEDAHALRVGVYSSAGAPFHHLALFALWGVSVRPVRAEDIHAGILETLDVLVFPGGGLSAMAGMLTPLGTNGATLVRRWVAQGGMYVGSCAGSFLPLHVDEAYWQAHEEARELHMINTTLLNGGNGVAEGINSPGVGTLNAALSNTQHWLANGVPDTFKIVHYNGPLFDPRPAVAQTPLGDVTGVVKPLSTTDDFTAGECFTNPTAPQPHLIDHAIKQGAYNAVTAPYEHGTIVLFGSHPEFGFNSLQLGWGPVTRLLANALTYQINQKNQTPASTNQSPIPAPRISHNDLKPILTNIITTLEFIHEQFQMLETAPMNDWLLTSNAPSFMGRDPKTLWRDVTQEAARTALVTRNLLDTLELDKQALDAALFARVAGWLTDEPNANQDVGFMGLTQLVTVIHTQLRSAQQQVRNTPFKLAHAYDGMTKHPYQLAVSSYLSAAGLTADAFLLTCILAVVTGQTRRIPAEYLFDNEQAVLNT